MNKWKQLLEKKWIWPVAAFSIPFVVSVCICAAYGIYPFGENCILHVDMYHQYCPFFIEFRDKLVNGGSLLYSWNLGLGADFVALFAYYLASPLNWFLLLCPEGLVIEFMTLTTWIKIGVAGLCFFYYLKEHFQLLGKDKEYHLITVLPALVFSTAYALSGYIATYSWNIMWMDSVAIAPLIILGLERLVKQNKSALYYITLSVSIWANWYVSMIICIFLVLYFAILFLEQKGGKIKAVANFAWFSLLAGGTGAILLLPEAIMLGYSGSTSEWPKAVKWYFGLVEELSRLCIGAEPHTGNDHWPALYCGIFTVFLVIMYVFNKRIKWYQKLLRVALLALFIVSFSNNYLDFIWHGLRFPTSLPGRQSFLFVFLMLAMGFEAYRKRKGNTLLHAIIASGICMLTLVMSMNKTDTKVTDSTAFILTAVFLLAYLVVYAANDLSSRKYRPLVRGFVFGLAMAEVIINMCLTGFYATSRTSYLAKTDDYHALLAMAEEDAKKDAKPGEQIFYRVEDYERKTKNDDCLYGYPSGTIFSSLMNIEVSHFFQSVYMEGGKNYYCYNGATPIVSSMLSVKYMLSDNAEAGNGLRTLIGQSGNYYLYENKHCLPLGFMMTEAAIENWNNDQGNKINQINSLATALGAEDYMMVRISDPTIEVKEGKTTITIKRDGFYYIRHQGCDSSTLSIRKNNGPTTRYNKASHRYLFELGECKNGDVITITNSNKEKVDFYLYRMKPEVVEQAYSTLTKQSMVTESFTDTSVSGYIDVAEAGRLIFSIPMEEGWSVYVDGEKAEVQDFKKAFISVHLEEGHHTIELRYMTPGLIPGAILTGSCILLFAATMMLRQRLANKKLQAVAEIK